jgi:translocation and assembly module TamA
MIAPSRRLYGGGGASVRGYGFQGVGPRDGAGNPTGGASLVEFSAEARIETPLMGGAVEVVPFIDAGSVSRSSAPDFDEIRWGAGIGIRYKTTFGPIRVDVATPLNPTAFDSPVVVYVSLGQAF